MRNDRSELTAQLAKRRRELEDTPRKAAARLRWLREERKRVDARTTGEDYLPPEQRKQAKAAAAAKVKAELAELYREHEAKEQEYARLLDRARRPRPLDAASEARAMRRWSALERRLDRQEDAAQARALFQSEAEAAAKAGDDATLAALREDGLAYLSDRGLGTDDLAEWMDAASSDPLRGKAVAYEAELTRGHGRVIAGRTMAQRYVEVEGYPMGVFPGWTPEDGTVVDPVIQVRSSG